MTPDSRWLPFLRLGLGYFIVFVLTGLALVIGLGKVEEKASFGLQQIEGALAVLAGACANYAFRAETKEDKKPTD